MAHPTCTAALMAIHSSATTATDCYEAKAQPYLHCCPDGYTLVRGDVEAHLSLGKHTSQLLLDLYDLNQSMNQSIKIHIN